MSLNRREFLAASAGTLALTTSNQAAQPKDPPRRPNRIAVSTYSFWQFRNKDLRGIETCIDLAAEMGFDGVEILHRQMERRGQRLPATAQAAGVPARPRPVRLLDAPDLPVARQGRAAEEHRAHDPLHRAGLRPGHPDDARQHRHLGHEQELRRADEEQGHRAAAGRATPTRTASAG